MLQTPHNFLIEQRVLSGLIKFGDKIWPQVESFLDADSFYSENQKEAVTVFNIIKSYLDAGKALDIVVIAEKINSLGIQFDDITVMGYLEGLSGIQISEEGIIEAVKELVSLKIRRKLFIALKKQATLVAKDTEKNVDELISSCDSVYSEIVREYSEGTNEPKNVFDDVDSILEGEPKEQYGLKTPFPKFNDYYAGFAMKESYGFIGRPENGKAQPLYSKILMYDGSWKTMGEVKIGDKIASIDGNFNEIIGIYPQGIKDIYEITLYDGRKCRGSKEHLWKVKCKEWEQERILDTNELIRLNNMSYGGYLSFPNFEGVYSSNRIYIIPPYVLGILIGDGCFYLDGSITLASFDPEIVQRANLILKNTDYVFNKKGGNGGYSLSNKNFDRKNNYTFNEFNKEIKRLGLNGKQSHNKYIPVEYFEGDYLVRIELLRGLMDTDGSISKGGDITYCTTSEKLAEDIQYLVRSLGGQCHTELLKDRTYRKDFKDKNSELIKCRDIYLCRIRHQDGFNFFSLDRKRKYGFRKKNKVRLSIKAIDYIGKEKCQCITVSHPSHLYITDNFIVTHNSSLLDYLGFSVGNLIDQTGIIGQKNIPVIKLDTEMPRNLVRDRMIAKLSSVDLALIQNKKYKQNKELYDKVYKAIEQSKLYKYEHIYCPNWSIDEMVNTVKRWIYRFVGRESPYILIFDYLKLQGEKLSEHNKEYQQIGTKLDKLHTLIKDKSNGVLLFGMQMNRYGINSSGKQVDDESTMSGGDRPQHYASFTSIIRRKTLEELSVLPVQSFGSHKWIITKAGRVQGIKGRGNMDIVKINGKYERNFINLDMNNFNIREMGDAEDVKKFIELNGVTPALVKDNTILD